MSQKRRLNGGYIIGAEINAYQRVAGEAIFEIGRRLKHVKENDLAHGEYEKWLDSIEINKQQAHRFVKVFEEFNGGKVTTSLHLGLSTLYEIATLPPEHREVPHELPSGETKKMWVRTHVKAGRDDRKRITGIKAPAKASRTAGGIKNRLCFVIYAREACDSMSPAQGDSPSCII